MNDCDTYKGLLMGLMDGELTPEENVEIHRHLIRCASCRKDYEELLETSEKLGLLTYQEPSDESLPSLWKPPYSHLARISGLFLVFGGWILLMGFSLYEWFKKKGPSLFPKMGILMLMVGFLVLLGVAIRERLAGLKTDPYKEVIR